MVEEAKLVETDGGLEPRGEGWFVLNAREAKWLGGHFGAYTRFEGDPSFPELGINIGVLAPGQPACYYHGEGAQEGFLVLSGGLTAANVGAAIESVRPVAVDVSSGVEMSKGIKDHSKIAAFVAAVRKADESI